MRMILVLALVSLPLTAVPALAGPGNEQGQVRRDMRAGNVRSLRDIERRVLPMMPGAQYLGPEYDPVALVYRLKFIREGRVAFVDVDARSGEVLRQAP